MAETTVTSHTTSATTIVDATPAEVFEFVRRPSNHPVIAGTGTVRDVVKGPDVLGPGDRFSMDMKWGVPYRVGSKVVEFEQDRRIAWAHLGRHRWRWEMEPVGDGQTRVTETFDMAPSPFKLVYRTMMGLPEGHEVNVERSVENVAAHFAS